MVAQVAIITIGVTAAQPPTSVILEQVVILVRLRMLIIVRLRRIPLRLPNRQP